MKPKYVLPKWKTGVVCKTTPVVPVTVMALEP